MIKYNKNRMLILGIMHAVQSKEHLRSRINTLKKKGFNNKLINEEKRNLLAMREEMLRIIKKFNPDLIAEESGPYKEIPGDIWKKIYGIKKSLLEGKYSKKHLFVDAKLLKSLKKPSIAKREKIIASQIIRIITDKKIDKTILIIGASHLKNIAILFKNKNFNVKAINLKEKFFRKFLKKYFKKQ